MGGTGVSMSDPKDVVGEETGSQEEIQWRSEKRRNQTSIDTNPIFREFLKATKRGDELNEGWDARVEAFKQWSEKRQAIIDSRSQAQDAAREMPGRKSTILTDQNKKSILGV
jgi:hypothetical protein